MRGLGRRHIPLRSGTNIPEPLLLLAIWMLAILCRLRRYRESAPRVVLEPGDDVMRAEDGPSHRPSPMGAAGVGGGRYRLFLPFTSYLTVGRREREPTCIAAYDELMCLFAGCLLMARLIMLLIKASLVR